VYIVRLKAHLPRIFENIPSGGEETMTFEYNIIKIPAQAFENLAIFCSEKGECALEDVPGDQIRRLTDMLNERGTEGWELVQLFFQETGVVGVWKRKKI
jgi:hypothetical protein